MTVSTRAVRSWEPVGSLLAPGTRSRARARWTKTLLVAAPALVLVILVADWSLALIRPETRSQVWLWTTVSTGAPVWFGAAILLATVPATLLLSHGSRLPDLAIEGLLVAEFTAYYASTRMSPMTGDSPALLRQAGRPDAWLSEPLADAVHKIAFHLGGDQAVLHVGPFVGATAVAAWLFLARRAAAHWGIPLDLLRAFPLATPLTFWFFVDYTENTFLAIPFLLCAMALLIGPRQRGTMVAAGLAIGLAVAMHAMNLLMVAAAAAALALRPGLLIGRSKDVLAVVGAAVLTEAIVLVACLAAGLRFNAYNMSGGYDHTMWTPLAPDGYLFRFTFFSHAHLIELANISVHSAPLLVLALPILILRRRRALRQTLVAFRSDDRMTLLALMSLGFLAFAGVWGFDFGPSGDLDLMLVMSVPLSLYVLVVVHRLVRHDLVLLYGLVAASAICELAFYSYRVSLVWWPPA